MPSPKSLHPCIGCKFAQSVQGYMNVCVKPERLAANKRGHYTEINQLACGSVISTLAAKESLSTTPAGT